MNFWFVFYGLQIMTKKVRYIIGNSYVNIYTYALISLYLIVLYKANADGQCSKTFNSMHIAEISIAPSNLYLAPSHTKIMVIDRDAPIPILVTDIAADPGENAFDQVF